MSKSKKTAEKKKDVFGKRRLFKAPVVVGADKCTITFPKSVIKYLELVDGEVFWTPVGGVIQMSGQLPHMVIPMLSVDDGAFVPHEKEKLAIVEQE